jgi:transcriptional regulator with XRE-family HTH domain
MERGKTDELLAVIKRQIEEKKGGEKLEQWRYTQFKVLAEDIAEASGIKISHTTLIRIFKKKSPGNTPQLSTLEALVIYLGYENLEGFTQKNEQKKFKQGTQAVASPSRQLKPVSVVYITSLLLILTTAIILFNMFGSNSNESVSIELVNESNNGNRLTFKYKVPEDGYHLRIVPKSFQPYGIKQKKFRGIVLPKEDSILNHTMDIPCNYLAMIVKDEQVLAKLEGNIHTQGWLCILESRERKKKQSVRYENVKFKPVIEDGSIGVPLALSQKIRNSFIEKSFITNYMRVQDYQINANELVFETRFMNVSDYDFTDGELSRVTLLTESGFVEIPLVSNNYLSPVKLWVSDHVKYPDAENPSKYEMASLSNKWINLRIELTDFQCKIYLNGQFVDSVNYKEPLGQLTGIRYKFIEKGIVDYCKIMRNDEQIVYYDDFDQVALTP